MKPLPIHADRDACMTCDVRHLSVCRAIDDRDIATLSSIAMVMEVERGQTFIREGDPSTDFYNVTQGNVKLFKLLPDGRQQITGFAGAGYFLGLAVSQTYAFSAQAIAPVRVCRFSRPKLHRLMGDFPRLEAQLLQTACNELVAAQEQMLLLGRKTAAERLASFLTAPNVATNSNRIHLPMTRSEIAGYLGLTIETVSRTFSHFRKGQRIATPSHDEVVLLDCAWLQNVADGVGA